MQFSDFQLNNSILKALAKKNYEVPTPIQIKTIPLVLSNKDIIASAQTGTGKTAAFAIPIIEQLIATQDAPKKGKKIKALVLSPTRELALQIEESFKSYSVFTNLRTTVVYGGVSIEPQIDVLQKGVDILIATPGRLLDLVKQEMVNLATIETFVIDEADLMLDMGFIEDVFKINRLCPDKKQSLLFSATMPDKVVFMAKSILKNPENVAVSPTSSVTTNVNQLLFYVPKPKKIELCLHLLRNSIKGDIIIFRRTKFGVDKLEKTLLSNGYKVDTIHGDKTQNAREEALNRFKNKEVTVLIATDLASRGLDIKNLDAVINFDIPNIAETYVHRIGRTGRAGEIGHSYSFCSADEKPYIIAIQKVIGNAIQVEENHPYPLDPKAKLEIHKKQGSKYQKGRKSEASKKKKKRWY